MGLGRASDRVGRVSKGAERASDRDGRALEGSGRDSVAVGRASKGANRALGGWSPEGMRWAVGHSAT